MGQNKKLGSIIDAVKNILGEDVKVKKLKKVKALESFIKKLEEREAELQEGAGGSKKEGEKQLAILKKQIKKAKKILEEQKEDS